MGVYNFPRLQEEGPRFGKGTLGLAVDYPSVILLIGPDRNLFNFDLLMPQKENWSRGFDLGPRALRGDGRLEANLEGFDGNLEGFFRVECIRPPKAGEMVMVFQRLRIWG
jgi:hypothetical protein